MTPKQEAFVREYLVDLNATQAAIRAGYSAKNADKIGPELLGKTRVREAIEAGKKELAERVQVNQEYVIKTILETIERCRQATPVTDKTGKPIMAETENGTLAPVYAFDAKNVLKGAELLGKHLGIFIEKRELTGKDGKDLVPEQPKGVLVVPGVLDEKAWEKMMSKQEGGV